MKKGDGVQKREITDRSFEKFTPSGHKNRVLIILFPQPLSPLGLISELFPCLTHYRRYFFFV